MSHPGNNNTGMGLPWSPAERWASIARPTLVAPQIFTNCEGGEEAANLANRHFLLTTLQNDPACQISFSVSDTRMRTIFERYII